MLAELAIIERDDFVPCVWSGRREWVEDGRVHRTGPWPRYHEAWDRVETILYETTAWIHPYDPLPEDAGDKDIHWTSERLAGATLDQVRRYLVGCSRSERFGEGCIASEFASGGILAALRRVRELTSKNDVE